MRHILEHFIKNQLKQKVYAPGRLGNRRPRPPSTVPRYDDDFNSEPGGSSGFLHLNANAVEHLAGGIQHPAGGLRRHVNHKATAAIPRLYGFDNITIGWKCISIRIEVMNRSLYVIEHEN